MYLFRRTFWLRNKRHHPSRQIEIIGFAGLKNKSFAVWWYYVSIIKCIALRVLWWFFCRLATVLRPLYEIINLIAVWAYGLWSHFDLTAYNSYSFYFCRLILRRVSHSTPRDYAEQHYLISKNALTWDIIKSQEKIIIISCKKYQEPRKHFYCRFFDEYFLICHWKKPGNFHFPLISNLLVHVIHRMLKLPDLTVLYF